MFAYLNMYIIYLYTYINPQIGTNIFRKYIYEIIKSTIIIKSTLTFNILIIQYSSFCNKK